ncbi:AGE family epimerase/isomerase [Marinomonas ostreistagni]|uniref:AGE family epimerase/isomerase n=1 Tax=Marinomonas ostreistagni TaxID=359209 RepID=UPI0019504C12|nr:AGE family epimerase/isomerase [Marinomonas ostreistagni]MBM6551468.1 AGE family epimerase/isomerase [Marinomonas ostreistagni]
MNRPNTKTSTNGQTMTSAHHDSWLLCQGRRLLAHYQAAQVASGFGALDDAGQLTSTTAVTLVTARMVHSYSLAALMGVEGAAELVDHGLKALLEGPLRDHKHGGWFEDESQQGRKEAYVHAFVALAAASASMAQRPRASELLKASTEIIDQRFWLEDEAVMAPSFAADWSDCEDYRGANANMHATEAFLALWDATGEMKWLDRSLALVKRFGHDIARVYDYRLPEHFDRHWQMLPDFNVDKPKDDFRPWGMTPGHFSEWAGLMLKVEAALMAHKQAAPDWLLPDAMGLLDSAVALGWGADGKPGMVYTIGWNDEVSVANRPWWVQAETANAAYLFMLRTGERRFEVMHRMAWGYIADSLIDAKYGGWLPEVDQAGQRTFAVYPLRDDLYHALQATLTPLLPLTASLAAGVRQVFTGK